MDELEALVHAADPQAYAQWGLGGALVFLMVVFLIFLSRERSVSTRAWRDAQQESAERYQLMADTCHAAQDRSTVAIRETSQATNEALRDTGSAVRDMSTATIELREEIARRRG